MTPPSRTYAVLIGGAFNGVLSALPVVGAANCLCCLWVVGGGAVTAWLLQQGQAEPLELGEGALGGLLAGVAGAAFYALVSVPFQLLMGSLAGGAAGRSMLGDVDVPPEMLPMIEMMEQVMSNPGLMALMGFLVMLVAGAVFSTLGGLLGAFFFRKGAPPAAPEYADIVPPPPPA